MPRAKKAPSSMTLADVAAFAEALDGADFLTIPHFNGYAAVLIALDAARPDDVRAAIEAAWRCEAARPAPRKRKPTATRGHAPSKNKKKKKT